MKAFKKGYTLVELVVVLMIMAILLGAATFGLYSYTRYAKFKNYNEDAQTLYVAAQEALTHYKASGQLADYAAQVKTYALKTSDAPNYNKIKPAINSEYNGRLYTIFYSADYIKNEKGYNDKSHELFEQLMARYLSNHNVMDGNIAIEFDPSDGVVYSISYSLQADHLYYGKDQTSDKDEIDVDITNRNLSVRKNRMFGYYDVNNITAAAPLDAEKPTITDLELVNGESLYLKWAMDDIYNEVAESFEYNIELYDGSENYTNSSQALMKFKINSADNLIPDQEAALPEVTCQMVKGNLSEEYKLRSYKTIENNRTYFYVVLDAVDLSSLTYVDSLTGNYQTYAINNEKLDETYSFERFDLNTNSIYARVRASSSSFKSSVWKQSNIEDTLFASREDDRIVQDLTFSEILTVTANISNNRHLYNIRFIEDKELNQRNLSNRYIYKQINNINYNKAEVYKTVGKTDFDGSDDRQVIRYDSNNLPSFPSLGKLNMDNQYTNTGDYQITNLKLGDDENENGVGLFKVNKGIIDGLVIKDVKVEGKEDVGAITAYNSGTIRNAKVSGNVKGIKNIGGITGTVMTSIDSGTILIDNCSNSADIEGNENVGGIIGISDQGIIVNKCDNTGRIMGTANKDYAFSSKLGGIAGYNGLKSQIIESTSASKWTDKDALTSSSTAQYVGGIAGINNGTIKNCATGISNQSTYVVGDKFVGGIVGAQEDQGVLTNTTVKANKCIVVGNENVGGIIGYNTKAISNWNNEGVIICRNNNGGGITGYNASEIINCRSSVRYNALTIKYDDIITYSTGSNIGGVAGVNEGLIFSITEQENIVIAAGHDNVGGIAGINKGTMKNQKVTGGYINGNDNVGGSIGYNSSEDTLRDQTIKVNVNQIEGHNNVAGAIGYNQVILDQSVELNVSFNTDSFAGYVAGENNVGGFIGLNDVLCKKLTIGSDAKYSNDMNYIKGNIYVGGIIGKDISNDVNNPNNHTMVEIKNIDNKTRVISTGYVSEYDQDLKGYINYSYSAGIIGRNTEYMTINNCSNQKQVTVHDAVQYLGGLIEVNEGAVINCTTYSLGNYTRSNVGGLVGKNAAGANMDNCSLSGIITGKDNIGGFAVDNYGNISNSNSSANAAVNANGINIGGLAARNYSEINGANTSIAVNGNGTNAGGIIGLNVGNIKNIKMSAAQNITGNAYVGGIIGKHTSGNLSGLHNINNVTAKIGDAGGVVGTIDVTKEIFVTDCVNTGLVVSIMNNAGGITSEVSKAVVLKNTINDGDIKATLGHAGGIVAINKGTIESSKVTNGVEITGRGYVGGIATENHGIINECQIGQVDLSVYGAVLTGNDKNIYIGGVSAKNMPNGQIINTSSFENTSLLIDDSFENSYFGGVVGLNEGTIISDDNAVISADIGSSNSNFDAYLGGIAGYNKNKIAGYTFVGTVIGKGGSGFGYGGIAGINEAEISDCKTTDAKIQTTADSASTGGIAGHNKNNGTITNSIINGKTTIQGPQNINGSAYIGYVGGIAGTNEGNVENCNHASLNDPVTVSTGKGNLGGIVGFNTEAGRVNNCSTGASWNPIQSDLAGTDLSTGGIIGYSNSSTDSYTNLINYAPVTKKAGNSVAGILGRLENNASLWTVSNCENYGTITGANGGEQGRIGGIIGQIKYKGGNITDCLNSGDIICRGTATGLGGIAGYVYILNANETINISNCRNLGNIPYSEKSAGILGEARNTAYSSSSMINISNCTNAGEINKINSAGIVILSGTTGKYNVTNCVNYYKFGQNSGGIINANNKPDRLEEFSNNIDAGVSYYPSINYETVKTASNYYFSSDSSQDLKPLVDRANSTITSKNKVVEGDAANNNNQVKDKNILYDDSTKQRFTVDMNKYGGLSGEKFNNELVFTTKINSTKETISSLQTYWYNGNDNYGESGGTPRKMDYKIVIHTLTGKITYPSTGTYSKDKDNTNNRAYFTNDSFEPVTGVTSIDLVVTGGTSRYVSIYEIKVNERDNVVIDQSDNTLGTSKLIVEKEDDIYKGINETNDISITDMKIDPTISKTPGGVFDTLAKYKYDNLDPAISGYTNGDTNDFGKYQPIFDSDIIDNGGQYKVSWQFNDNNGKKINASRYLLEIKDSSNEVKYSTVIYGNTYGYLPVNSTWGKVNAYVTALSNTANSKTSSPKSIMMKEPLKTPDFNFVANKNDKFDIIINNLEDYNVGDIITFNSKYTYTVGVDTTKTIDSFGYDSFATAQATPGKNSSKYGNSVMFSAQTSAVLVNNFATNIINFVDFKGTSANSLRYEITFNTGYRIQDYYRQDLLLPDEAINGLPVVVSSSIYRVNQYATNMITELTAIPESIANQDKVRIQSYVWSAQNNITHYYRYLYKNLTVAQLNDHIGEFTTNNKLNDGYVIEKNNDDTYSVYFSLSLEKGISEMNLSSDTNKRYIVKDIDVPASRTKPLIDQKTPQLKDGKYTFKWTVADDPNGKDSYNITVYGVDKSGGEVELVNENIKALAYTTDDATQWNYKQLRVVVTHLGTENSSGYTDKLAASSTAVYDYKLKLTQVTAPLVSIVSDKHSYTYNVLFDQLIDAEEIMAVAYYEVYAQTKVDGKVFKIMETTLSDNCSIVLDFVDEDGKGVIVPEGNEIEFYVNAIAKTENETFTDSLTGDISTITLPHRIARPDSKDITISEGPMSVDEINTNGIIITKVSNTTEDLDANYEIKYLLDGYHDQYSEPKTMDGNISSGSINLKNLISGNLSDHAGRKIKFMLRAVSSQAVSSKWSDEVTLTLPKGKIDFDIENINISENRESLPLYENDVASSIKYELNQKSITLPALKYSNGYDFAINYQQLETLEDKYRFYHSLKIGDKEVKRVAFDHIRINDKGITTNPDGTINEDRFIINYDVYSLQQDARGNYVVDKDGNYLVINTPTKLNEYETKRDEFGNINTYIYSFDYMAKTYNGITPSGNKQSLTVVPKLYINLDMNKEITSYQLIILDTVGHSDTILDIYSDKAITANIRFTALANDHNYYADSQILEYYREQFENTFVEGTRVYDPSQSIRSYLEKMLNANK